jgi:Fe-S-cluster containining protein
VSDANLCDALPEDELKRKLEDAGSTPLSQPINLDVGSLCESCADPGRCCQSFTISSILFPFGTSRDVVRKHLRSGTRPRSPRVPAEPLPFEPTRPCTYYGEDPKGPPEEEAWIYSCPELKDGRCSIYDERPLLCRNYQPGKDLLCAMYRGSWEGEVKPYEKEREEDAA